MDTGLQTRLDWTALGKHDIMGFMLFLGGGEVMELGPGVEP